MKTVVTIEDGAVKVETDSPVIPVVTQPSTSESFPLKVGGFAEIIEGYDVPASLLVNSGGLEVVLSEYVKLLARNASTRTFMAMDAWGDIGWVTDRQLKPAESGFGLTKSGETVVVEPGDFLIIDEELVEVFGFDEDGDAICFPYNFDRMLYGLRIRNLSLVNWDWA